MRSSQSSIWRTFLRGSFLVLPVALGALVLAKIVAVLRAAMEPIASRAGYWQVSPPAWADDFAAR